MTSKLEAIRAKLSEKGNASPTNDHASFPFWNLQENTNATFRFLPDGDANNVFFWAERTMIKLPFAGNVIVQVPCMHMFGESCAILDATREWWKDPAKTDLARAYYKKRSYIFQGFVVTSPIIEDIVPENPIRRFVINPSIFKLIKDSLMNPEFEDMPTDYDNGRDFRLTKTKKGTYADYTTSHWSFKTRALSATERDAITANGLFNLKEFLGAKPDAEQLLAIKAMFEASLAGEPFDQDKYGKWFRPSGANFAPTNTSITTVSAPTDTRPAANTAGILDRIAKRNTASAA